MNKQIEYYQNKLEYEMDPSDLFEALERGEKIMPLDTRRSIAYEKDHIPGAVNIPHRDMDEKTTRHLDKSKLYACYCNGVGCNASTRGALKMTKLGFRVKEVAGGIEHWKKDGYLTEGTHSTEGLLVKCEC